MATYNILMKRFAGGTSWDVLRPLTISDNVSDDGQTNKFVTAQQITNLDSLFNSNVFLGLLKNDPTFTGNLSNNTGSINLTNNGAYLVDGIFGMFKDNENAYIGTNTNKYLRMMTGGDLIVGDDASGMKISYAADYGSLSNLHLVPKEYVDNLALGVKPKTAVKVRTTSNIALTGVSSIDGYTLVNGDRILLVAQTNASQNGVYRWATGGGLTKLEAAENETGVLVSVTNGTTGAGERWYNLNTTNGLWIQFDSQIDVQAGSGIAVSGATVSIATGGVSNAMLAGSISASKLSLAGAGGLENSSNNLQIKKDGVTNDMLEGNIALSKLANTTFNQDAYPDWFDFTVLSDDTLTNNVNKLFSAIKLLRGTSHYSEVNPQTISDAYDKIGGLTTSKNRTTLDSSNPSSEGRVVGDLHFQYEAQ